MAKAKETLSDWRKHMENTSVLNPQIPIEKYFEELSRIPRESGNEEAVSAYIVRFAQERGLSYTQDALWNDVIYKDASSDKQAAEPVILRVHMDMVCAKTAACSHDFQKDPIALHLEDGILTADGTTLGADDGFGAAYMLAVLEDDTLPHPPLECVFTVQEEMGTIGAEQLDESLLKAKRMINLDGDEEGATFEACSCSDRVLLDRSYEE